MAAIKCFTKLISYAMVKGFLMYHYSVVYFISEVLRKNCRLLFCGGRIFFYVVGQSKTVMRYRR